MMAELKIVTRSARWIGFGFILIFCGNFGQTFFIGLFSGELRAAFNIGNQDFGLLYSTATLASAVLLIWTGPLIDRVNLAAFVGTITVVLAIGIFTMASASHVVMVGVAMFMLRHCGQALMFHAGQTSMVRFFRPGQRGFALALAGTGMSVGEAGLPKISVEFMGHFGWRVTWLAAGVFVVFIALPTLLTLLRGWRSHIVEDEHEEVTEGIQSGMGRSWTRAEAVRDLRFYGVMSLLFGFSFIITGLFIHQAHVATAKGWSLDIIANTFILYAGASVVTGLTVGRLIDRLGAHRVMPFFPLPLAGAMVVLALSNGGSAVYFYMILVGSTVAAAMTLMTAIWVEFYGTRNVGSIRALSMALIVLASALSPVIFGAAFDHGVSVPTVAWACFGYMVAAGCFCTLVLRRTTVSRKVRSKRSAAGH